MIDEKLKNYIRYEIKKGRSKEEIRQALLNAGHKLENIEQHFNLIEEEIKKRGNPLLYLFIFFVLLSIFLGIFSIGLYTKQISPYEYSKL
ncbi:hypothetical protein HYX04_01740, partial [Candidatus Woesearchaeota archaeon]|nr:hypothetical protein [Candidatus Woesearchaeota archaeon]